MDKKFDELLTIMRLNNFFTGGGMVIGLVALIISLIALLH